MKLLTDKNKQIDKTIFTYFKVGIKSFVSHVCKGNAVPGLAYKLGQYCLTPFY